MLNRAVFSSFGIVFALCSATTAADVSVWLSGQDFDGGPAFVVQVGEVTIGNGVIDLIPTDPDGVRFDFTVADELLGSQPLSIKLTNDAYEAGVGDRNLIVIRAKVGGAEIALSDFEFRGPDGTVLDGSRGVLASNGQVAVAAAPAAGWPVRAEAPAEMPASSSTADVGQPPASAQPDGGPDCTETSVRLEGYATGVIEPSGAAKALLADAVSYAGCSVIVTGFSSTSGPEELNRQIALQRAEAVRTTLEAMDTEFSAIDVLVGGETDQFGPAQADNRVVVVEFK
jgi:outer membrane protein OmpA-like peptidoglycan-associated protein